MVYFVELSKGNEAHSSLNYSMIKVLSSKYNSLKIFASVPHFKAIGLKDEDLENVIYHKLRVVEGNWTSWPAKVAIESYNAFKIFYRARNDNVQLVYISSVFPISQLFIKIIKKFFPTIRVIIGLHGEMEFLKRDKSTKLKLLGWFLKSSFKLSCDNLKYLVFGDVIKENLKVYTFLNQEQLISIDHPYDYRVNKSSFEVKFDCLKLGTIGIGSVNKRTHNLFLLSNFFKREVFLNKICFNLIGTMRPDLERFVNPYVKTNGYNMILSKEEFENQISGLHYSLFFYDNAFYSLCASGAFFDAVKFEKPILAFKNDYFSYYFGRLGNIGYLFDDITAMNDKIRDILNGNCRIEYYEQVENLQRARQQLSIENIANDFFNQLNNNEFLK